MAILRAGPFASSSDSFLDESSPALATILPVNCASDATSEDWPWRFAFETRSDGDDPVASYVDGLPDVSASDASLGTFRGYSYWRYQATGNFSLNFSYTVTASSDGGGFQVASFEVRTGIGGTVFFDIDQLSGGTATVSGSTIIEFPPSIVPERILVRADTDSTGGGSLSYTITPVEA